jgi:hypothetical protein
MAILVYLLSRILAFIVIPSRMAMLAEEDSTIITITLYQPDGIGDRISEFELDRRMDKRSMI